MNEIGICFGVHVIVPALACPQQHRRESWRAKGNKGWRSRIQLDDDV